MLFGHMFPCFPHRFGSNRCLVDTCATGWCFAWLWWLSGAIFFRHFFRPIRGPNANHDWEPNSRATRGTLREYKARKVHRRKNPQFTARPAGAVGWPAKQRRSRREQVRPAGNVCCRGPTPPKEAFAVTSMRRSSWFWTTRIIHKSMCRFVWLAASALWWWRNEAGLVAHVFVNRSFVMCAGRFAQQLRESVVASFPFQGVVFSQVNWYGSASCDGRCMPVAWPSWTATTNTMLMRIGLVLVPLHGWLLGPRSMVLPPVPGSRAFRTSAFQNLALAWSIHT